MPTTSSTDDVTVAYLRLSPEEPAPAGRPRMLLAHATGFSATVWRPLAAALAARFDCWALDFRGHGRSTRPADGRFDWNGTADDVLAVIDAVDALAPPGSGPWFGVGHSMGGASLLLAEQRRPATLAAAWVYEPVIFPAPLPGPNPLSESAARRRATFASRQDAFDNYASKPPMNVFDGAALDGYLERGLVDDPSGAGVRLACEPSDEAQVYRMGAQHDAWSHLTEVRCPVTVVVGDTAGFGPAGFAAGVAERIPHGRLETHPDLGHFGPMEAPARMAASVLVAFEPVHHRSLSGPGPTIDA